MQSGIQTVHVPAADCAHTYMVCAHATYVDSKEAALWDHDARLLCQTKQQSSLLQQVTHISTQELPVGTGAWQWGLSRDLVSSCEGEAARTTEQGHSAHIFLEQIGLRRTHVVLWALHVHMPAADAVGLVFMGVLVGSVVVALA